MFDWQTIIVFLIIGAAAAFVGRRIFRRLRGFSATGNCETGCGKCSETVTKSANFVQLKRN